MFYIYQQAKAKEDLKNIWRYSYRNYGERQADQYYDALVKGIARLSANPHIGLACDDIRKGYRRYHIKQHIVFYRLHTNHILIVRVLHQSMDVLGHL